MPVKVFGELAGALPMHLDCVPRPSCSRWSRQLRFGGCIALDLICHVTGLASRDEGDLQARSSRAALRSCRAVARSSGRGCRRAPRGRSRTCGWSSSRRRNQRLPGQASAGRGHSFRVARAPCRRQTAAADIGRYHDSLGTGARDNRQLGIEPHAPRRAGEMEGNWCCDPHRDLDVAQYVVASRRRRPRLSDAASTDSYR
jgi:hypothetical protein